MPEASIPGDRNPKNSFDDVVRELQEIKDNDEQYSNDNTELLLQIDDTLQKTSDSAMSQRNVINNIMQYQTELFGKLSDFAEMNNKAMLDQAENLKKLSETPKEKKDDKRLLICIVFFCCFHRRNITQPQHKKKFGGAIM